MKAEKYSRMWLLNELAEIKTKDEMLRNIIEYENEVVKRVRLILLKGVIVTLSCHKCNSEDLNDYGYFYTCNKCLSIADHKTKPKSQSQYDAVGDLIEILEENKNFKP